MNPDINDVYVNNNIISLPTRHARPMPNAILPGMGCQWRQGQLSRPQRPVGTLSTPNHAPWSRWGL